MEYGGSRRSLVCFLILRIFTLLFLLISLIIIAEDRELLLVEFQTTSPVLQLDYRSLLAHRYMIGATITSLILSLLQTGTSIHRLLSKRTSIHLSIDFYCDQIACDLECTAAAAGLGATHDLTYNLSTFTDLSALYPFYHRVYGSAAVLLLAFACNVFSSIISSRSLGQQYN